MTPERCVLHPQKGRAVLLVVCGLVGCLLGIPPLAAGAIVPGVLVAGIGIAGLGSGGLRLAHPRCYALEIDARGFRVHGVFGRVVRDVPWTELAQLIRTTGNAPWRPGGDTRMAWLCRDGTPGAERRRKRNGILIDGVLPDPYGLDFSALVALMERYSQLAAAPSSRGS
jgi:hypothetical protein